MIETQADGHKTKPDDLMQAFKAEERPHSVQHSGSNMADRACSCKAMQSFSYGTIGMAADVH